MAVSPSIAAIQSSGLNLLIVSNSYPSALPILTASPASRIVNRLVIDSRSQSFAPIPLAAQTPFLIAFATNFDHRSPHRLFVTFALSTVDSNFTISSILGVILPCTSPALNTVCFSPPSGTPRRTVPGPINSTAIFAAIQPVVLPQPTTLAIVSSLIQF